MTVIAKNVRCRREVLQNQVLLSELPLSRINHYQVTVLMHRRHWERYTGSLQGDALQRLPALGRGISARSACGAAKPDGTNEAGTCCKKSDTC